MPDINDVANIVTFAKSIFGDSTPQPARQPLPETIADPKPAHGGDLVELVPAIPQASPFEMLHRLVDSIGTAYTPNRQQIMSVVRNPQDYNHGGLLDTVFDMIGMGGGQVVDQFGGATKQALSAVARTVENVATYAQETRQMATNNKNALLGFREGFSEISRRVNGLTNDWDARFGSQGRTYRAALHAAQSIPGLRASSVLTGAHNQSYLKIMGEYHKTAKDLDAYVPVSAPAWTAYAAGVPADTQAAITEVRNELATLIIGLNNRFDALYDVMEVMADEDFGDAIDGLKAQTATDTIGALAGLAPSQIVTRPRPSPKPRSR